MNIIKYNFPKSFLIKEYIKNKKSAGQIAKENKCSHTTILNCIKKHNIKIRTISESHLKCSKLPTEIFLIREYVKYEKPMAKIAKKINCSVCTISKYLNLFNIKIKRSHLSYQKILTKKFLKEEYIIKNKPLKSIAKKIGCSNSTISSYLKLFDIPRKKPGYLLKGKKAYNYKGKAFSGDGYIFIRVEMHPNARQNCYVLEHRLVMEAHLNKVSYKQWLIYGRNKGYPKGVRFLTKKEIIHHNNGIKNDNRIKNLRLFKNQQAHTKFHQIIYCNSYKFIKENNLLKKYEEWLNKKD